MMWRNQHKIGFISLFLVSAIFLLTCGAHAQAGEKVAVFVSIPPQKYFLQQIGVAFEKTWLQNSKLR
jgi:ABC-type Zn uptake system ZnuABC Zn-binding protein ZnuA